MHKGTIAKMSGISWLLLLLLISSSAAQDQWRPVTERAPRPILRPRHSALSPAQLLQRAAVTRGAIQPGVTIPEMPIQMIEIDEEEESIRYTGSPPSPEPTTTSSKVPAKAKTTTSVPKTYRKSYSEGRREQQNPSPPPKQANGASLKELLKQSGTLSLSEILQQRNLSLADFLQGKNTALSAVKEKQNAENEVVTQRQEASTVHIAVSSTERTMPRKTGKPAAERLQPVPIQNMQNHHIPVQATDRDYPEVVYRAPITTRRPDLYRATQRSSYLKRKTTTAPPTYATDDEDSGRHWMSEDGNKANSREDILELLQPGSPVSLAALLSSRNMTLAELMDHRERGSRQQPLVALFSDLANGVTTTPSPRLADHPKRRKGNRDPRLLDLPRRFILAPEEADDEVENEKQASNIDKVTVEHYDYVEEDDDEEEWKGLPTAVKSAILASGGLLGVALVLFAAMFLCCRAQQRRQRGSRVPFIVRGKQVRTVIKPALSKLHDDPNDF